MNTKRFLLASLAVYLVYEITTFIIHGPLMGASYMETESVWRPEMMDYMWVMWLTAAAFSLTFTFIFIKGYENKGLLEGLRYGFIIGLLMLITGMFNQWVVYPIPFMMALQWLIYGMVQYLLIGLTVAAVYKPKK